MKKFIDIERIIEDKNPKAKRWIPKFLVRYLKRIFHQEEVNRIIEENKAEPLPDVPVQDRYHQSNINGLYLAGELTGMTLIRPCMREGMKVVGKIARELETEPLEVTSSEAVNDTPGSHESLDLIIVGGGPAGLAAAAEAKKKGLKFLLIEKDRWGQKIRFYPKGKPIVVVTDEMKLDSPLDFDETDRDGLLDQWEEKIGSLDLPIHEHEEVSAIQATGMRSGFQVTTTSGAYNARFLLLTVGILGLLNRLEIPGEDLEHVHTYLSDPAEFSDKSILVVGGGDAAIETASMLSDSNAVTLSYRKHYFSRLTSSNQQAIEYLEENGNVDVIYDSQVKEIRNDDVTLVVGGREEKKVQADEIFLNLGRRPQKKQLKEFGLEFEGDYSFMRTLRESMKKPVTRNDIIGCGVLIVIGLVMYYFLKYPSFTGNAAYFLGGYSLSFWYYTFYTLGVLGFGSWFMYRFRHARNRNILFARMAIIMIVQATVGYLFSNPDNNPFMRQATGSDFFNWEIYQLIIVWPLELQPVVWNWLHMDWVNWQFYLAWVLVFSFIGIPVGAFLFGKGFFCSGLCGCGALGETVGDPFRTKAARNKYAYMLEYSKYIILVWAIILTLVMINNKIIVENPESPFYHISYFIYWVFILWFLSSVIGVTTYPVLSGRSWCRYFCPMAAYLSLFSMISPNRIVTNKDRCIGCNACNENCQYGINIKGKAQLGKPVRTRECVQCGVCVAVCPTDALEVKFTLSHLRKRFRIEEGPGEGAENAGKSGKRPPKESSYRPYKWLGKLRE